MYFFIVLLQMSKGKLPKYSLI